ncbi:hypothetical protein AB205_0017000 [Aquarana catesbeiana]|uniref:Uncharacterized protein n=1 Tax=Aquarana catesbeiana TaxID=8400 RepID=A0A2G9RRD8_AQUCT|nr:hypothetical protein AB205_0017000 [Aquarana catesbeiana]
MNARHSRIGQCGALDATACLFASSMRLYFDTFDTGGTFDTLREHLVKHLQNSC